jgi:hypothetical protein
MMMISAIRVYQVDLPLRKGRYAWADGKHVDVFDSAVSDLDVYIQQPCRTYERCLSVREHGSMRASQEPGLGVAPAYDVIGSPVAAYR